MKKKGKKKKINDIYVICSTIMILALGITCINIYLKNKEQKEKNNEMNKYIATMSKIEKNYISWEEKKNNIEELNKEKELLEKQNDEKTNQINNYETKIKELTK